MGRLPRRSVLAAVIACAAPSALSAQVIQIQGTASSLESGVGAALKVWGDGYDGGAGIGYLRGLRTSLWVRRAIGRDTLRLGDDVIPLRLASDVFGSSPVILAQGAGLRARRGRTAFSVFAGASARALPSPLFTSTERESPLGYLHGESAISPRILLAGDAVVAHRQTLLLSSSWQPVSDMTASASAGVGGNAPYAASAFRVHRERFDVTTAYVYHGDAYRRADAPLSVHAEVEGANASATWRPLPSFAINAGRQHFRQDSVVAGMSPNATSTQASLSWASTALAASLGGFESQSDSVRNFSSFAYLRRDLTSWFRGDLYLLSIWEPHRIRSTTPVLYLRESLSPRAEFVQVVTRSDRGTTVNFGGALRGGLSEVSVDYQVVHSPLRVNDPFQTSMGLTVRLQLGALQLSLGSFVAPDGRTYFSASGGSFLYRAASSMGRAEGLLFQFDRFLVRGRVVDEEGNPVEGAAIRLGDETVYTNRRGEFFLRRPSAQALPLTVLPTDFLLPGTYETVSAPEQATPAREGHEQPVTIVVRKRA